MRQLLDYQNTARAQIVDFYQKYLRTISSLEAAGISTTTASTLAWQDSLERTHKNYRESIDHEGKSIPNCSVTIPTGGGKTATGLAAAADLATLETQRQTFIVWMVPSDAIYTQVKQSFSAEGAYYRLLYSLTGKKINLKLSTDTWIEEDLTANDSLTILLLSKDALVRDARSRKALLIYRNADNVSRLSCFIGHTQPSLFKLLELVKPIFVIDESHKIYTSIGQQFFQETSITRFVLELSATPKRYSEDHYPNIICEFSASDLIKHSLIKKGIKYNATIGQSLDELLESVIGLREILAKKLSNLSIQIKPRVLISSEFTGTQRASEEYSVDSICSKLNTLGVQRSEIIIKSSERNELKDRNLDNPNEPGNFILTKTALVEGWDCKSVYIIVLLNRIGADLTNTQIIGRGLRQPQRAYFEDESLNTLYLVTNSERYDTAIKSLTGYLYENGLSQVHVSQGGIIERFSIKLSLVRNLPTSHINFNRAIYTSSRIKKHVASAITQRSDEFIDVFSTRQIEHIQGVIDMRTGTAGASTHKELVHKKFEGRSNKGYGYNTLFHKLYIGMRNYFLSSQDCGLFVKNLMDNSLDKLSTAANDEQIVYECIEMAKLIQRQELNDLFDHLLKNNTELIEGLMSDLFGNVFEIDVVNPIDLLNFNNSCVEPVPCELFNNAELEYARFLDLLGVNWMKTTPKFKIDFPYPLGTFYPDFIVTLPNSPGSPTIYIETKGGHLIASEDSRAKQTACTLISKLFQNRITLIFGSFEKCRADLGSLIKKPS